MQYPAAWLQVDPVRLHAFTAAQQEKGGGTEYVIVLPNAQIPVSDVARAGVAIVVVGALTYALYR